jgi:hypothetical protein
MSVVSPRQIQWVASAYVSLTNGATVLGGTVLGGTVLGVAVVSGTVLAGLVVAGVVAALVAASLEQFEISRAVAANAASGTRRRVGIGPRYAPVRLIPNDMTHCGGD